jgi:hypothetical protein
MSASGRLSEPSNYARPADLRMGLCALAVYGFWSLLLIAQKPGLHYDEALHVSGAVHMLNNRGEFTLPHGPHTWACLRGRCFPLMSLPYTGAVKEYLCLPLFAVVGPRMSVIRVTSMLLGALGIWGVYVLARGRIGPRIAAAVAFLLAVNPSYIHQTVFDTSAVGAWMASFGFLCLMLSGYLRRASHAGAFLLGFAAGFAVWTRANFLWLLGSVALAALLALGRRLFPPLSHIARMGVGAVVGSAPFLVYQALSRGGTWEALGMYGAKSGFLNRAHARIVLLSETLMSDREHRAMWAAPEMPSWQAWLWLAMVLAACCVCLWPRAQRDAARRAWERIAALSFLFLTAVMLSSRLDVSEHHLVVVLPLAALAVALAGSAFLSHGRVAKGLVLILSGIYVCLAISWNQRAIAGLAATGGAGLWSDAAIPLTEHLEKFYDGKEIKILDWGLQRNLFVLSRGRVHSREIFADAPAQPAPLSGTYLLSGPTLRSFPEATRTFLAALDQQKAEARRSTIAQRNGERFAEIIDIQGDGCTGTAPASKVTTGDPKCAPQLEGFHRIEEEGWRWSSKQFAVTLGMPARRDARTASLTLRCYLPAPLIRKLGPLTLTAKLGGRLVAREVFRRAGPQVLVARLDTATLDPRANTFQFALDKCVEASPSDKRQLGMIVSSISLDLP